MPGGYKTRNVGIWALENDRVITALFQQERSLHTARAAAHDRDRAAGTGLDQVLVAVDLSLIHI